MTYKEFGYACLDLLKVASDDSYITLEHVIFLANKVRALILKLRYSDIRREIPESNYLTICLDLIEVPAISGIPCEGGSYLRSSLKVPATLSIGNPQIFSTDYYSGNITYVSRERMRYVGGNKWLRNEIYASLGPDGYLYFKSDNPQFLYLRKANMNAVFEEPEEASALSCDANEEEHCDFIDLKFPLEEGLVSTVMELIVKYLSGAVYHPKDPFNNAADDLSNLAQFIRQNMKGRYLKDYE